MNAEAQAEIDRAAGHLRAGGLVAFPTETVYGLGADALNEAAVRRVFALKGRPSSNPLIVHVADEAGARRVAADWPRRAELLAARFWPGPLTLVVPARPDLPPEVTAGLQTVGIRCPDHPQALALLRGFGGPLVGPSANPSGQLSPTCAEHVRADFGPAIAAGELMVLDGGPCRAGIESTVVSLVGPRPIILRPGVIGVEALRLVLGEEVDVQSPGLVAGPTPSPGMLERHYAPRAPAVLFEGFDWPEVIESDRGRPGRVVVVSHERSRSVQPPDVLIRLPMDAEGYAAALYAALRQADAQTPALIAIEKPSAAGPLWDAIRDRLKRATSAVGE